MAWGEPHALEKKMHRFFSERMVSHVETEMAQLVETVWENEGQARPYTDVELLLAACRRVIDCFAGLAEDPPMEWEPQPIPQPISWDSLSSRDRRFLQEALPAAAEWAPGVRLVLFGSRAAGTAGPDSDYDLFFIFPDQTEDWRRPQAIGSVSSLAIAGGIKQSWRGPPKASGLTLPRSGNRSLSGSRRRESRFRGRHRTVWISHRSAESSLGLHYHERTSTRTPRAMCPRSPVAWSSRLFLAGVWLVLGGLQGRW
jgi:hypothetical protein